MCIYGGGVSCVLCVMCCVFLCGWVLPSQSILDVSEQLPVGQGWWRVSHGHNTADLVFLFFHIRTRHDNDPALPGTPVCIGVVAQV